MAAFFSACTLHARQLIQRARMRRTHAHARAWVGAHPKPYLTTNPSANPWTGYLTKKSSRRERGGSAQHVVFFLASFFLVVQVGCHRSGMTPAKPLRNMTTTPIISTTGQIHGRGQDKYRWVSGLTKDEREAVKSGKLVLIFDTNPYSGCEYKKVIYYNGRFSHCNHK